jgi:hypothetical protein
MADALLTLADFKGRKLRGIAHLKLQGGYGYMYAVEDLPRLTVMDQTIRSGKHAGSTRTWMVDTVPVDDLETAIAVLNGTLQLADIVARSRPVKACTIWQPWASLIMVGAKPYEFRPRSYLDYANHPKPGEHIVIHAGVRPVKPAEVEDLLKRLDGEHDTTGLVVDRARELLLRVRAAWKYRLLPLGAGLGTAVIGKPRNAGTIFRGLPHDSDRGDFNWAWPLGDIRPFAAPVPARGYQGFWNWTGKIEEAA